MTMPPTELYQRAAALWPGVTLSADRFQSAWARLSDTQEGPAPEHAGDLYLAAACLESEPHAVAALRQRLQAGLQQLRSFKLPPSDEDTLVQDTLGALLGLHGAAPRLRSYSARGPLDGWLNVVLTRQVLALCRERQAPVELDEVVLGELATDAAPELELLKERFRGTFSAAFRTAIAGLTPRQRNLLRQHYLDQLSLEELGLLYRAHRATIARNLADARTALLEGTRDDVSRRLGIGRLEVDSIMRVVGSRLDISAAFFLSRS
jgi:RNA polymerase sigma-70 factor (ECF subfamily)